VGIFYPMASLIYECSEISTKYNRKTKIVADGGFREYSEIIKALAVGADYVMIGGILSKSIESCSPSFIKKGEEFLKITEEDSNSYFIEGGEVYKEYRGMSTKQVQKDWGKENIKTSEGIVKYNRVEYTFDSWIENFEDYLKSCMSYTNSKCLDDFIGKVKIVEISENSYKRFEK
jgi:IMP dehydrogenase